MSLTVISSWLDRLSISQPPSISDESSFSFVKSAEAFLLPNGFTVRGIVQFMTVILLVPNVIYRKVECIFVYLLILPKKREYVEHVQRRVITQTRKRR